VITKYPVSKREVGRREKAFLALSGFFLVGLFVGAKIFEVLIPKEFYIACGIIIFGSNWWIRHFFKKFLKMETILSKKYLIRAEKKYLIKNIKKITIKETTNNTVREIGIFFKDEKSLFINGLSSFEKFKSNLLKIVGGETKVTNSREPMDFDSIYFYPILGLILSFLTTYFLKIMMGLSYQTIQIIFYISLIYAFLVLIYLVVAKPISKRY